MYKIKMRRIRNLKTDYFPKTFVVIFFDGLGFDWVILSLDGIAWIELDKGRGGKGDLPGILARAGGKARTWVICWGMYEMLCWQGMENQIDLEKISLKIEKCEHDSEDDEEKFDTLAGLVSCGIPTIIDFVVDEQDFLCMDFANWGVDEVVSIRGAVDTLKDYVRMVKELKMGSLSMTAAGQGLHRYKRHDLGNYLVYAHQDPVVRKMERDAYTGGRCEAMQLGKLPGQIWHFDVKSMYAHLAHINSFPTKLLNTGHGQKVIDDLFRDSASNYTKRTALHVIAKVEIETNIAMYPCKHEHKTFYPIGNFITTLCKPELVRALQLGHVRQVFEWATYDSCHPFVENSKWYFQARESLAKLGLEHMAGTLKLSQNAMYGNIGKHGRTWVGMKPFCDWRWGKFHATHPVTDMPCEGRVVSGVFQWLDMSSEPEYSIPSISATMCSYGRVMLWDLMMCAGLENVYYYDTDGLMVNDFGAGRLWHLRQPDPILPGMIDVREKSDDVEVRGIKHYRFGDRWRQAGIPTDAERDEYGNVKFRVHQGFDQSLWHHLPFVHEYHDQKRSAWANYLHGTVDKDRKVWPLVFSVEVDEKTGGK